jgi:hypothetical protein
MLSHALEREGLMSFRSRVVTLAGSALVVGGLALAPAVFTAAPASAHTHVWIFACSSASGNGTSYTYTSDTITINGVTTTSSPAKPCP